MLRAELTVQAALWAAGGYIEDSAASAENAADLISPFPE
jgi:hypothetical protein